PTAQTAIQSGKHAAYNIERTLKGKPLKQANIQVKGLAIALGGHTASIQVGKIILSGYFAYLVKKLSERLYKWPLWWLVSKGYRKLDSCEI
ncbi:MAG: pyridine nucleotide-disulfide oxidoreductase, partial [Epsilonproteobacteria bacterium]